MCRLSIFQSLEWCVLISLAFTTSLRSDRAEKHWQHMLHECCPPGPVQLVRPLLNWLLILWPLHFSFDTQSYFTTLQWPRICFNKISTNSGSKYNMSVKKSCRNLGIVNTNGFWSKTHLYVHLKSHSFSDWNVNCSPGVICGKNAWKSFKQRRSDCLSVVIDSVAKLVLPNFCIHLYEQSKIQWVLLSIQPEKIQSQLIFNLKNIETGICIHFYHNIIIHNFCE